MATFYLDPTAITNGDGSVGSPFNSLQNALSGILTSFNSATEDFIVNCLAGEDPATDLAIIAIDSTSATPRVLRFVATGAHRHTGVRGTGYRFPNQIRVNNDNANVVVELTGLAFRHIQQDRSVAVTAVVRDCLVTDSASSGVFCGGGTIRLINTAVIGSTHANVVAENNNGSAIIEAINCTSVNAGADGGFVARFGGAMTAINCYSGGNAGSDFSGVTSPTNCYSEDGSQSTSTAAYNTANFTNVTAGSENLKLPSGSALIGAGVGPGSNANVPADDFEGDARSGATTDVGFDQFATSGDTATVTPSRGSITVSGLAPGANVFTTVRYQEVLINAAGSPVGGRTGLRFTVWYSGQCAGAPDLSYSDMTTGAAGTASYSIATGPLVFGQKVFGVITDGGESLSSYTCGLLTLTYS
jgi:hypothetical protein